MIGNSIWALEFGKSMLACCQTSYFMINSARPAITILARCQIHIYITILSSRLDCQRQPTQKPS